MPDWKYLFLSFEGRIRRRDFWIGCLIIFVASMILNAILSMAFPPAVVISPGGGVAVWPGMTPANGLVGLILLWPGLAVGAKRCHDRNQSAWWLLISVIPIVGFLWWLINLGILEGTPGPNQYGPSPKGLGGPAETAT